MATASVSSRPVLPSVLRSLFCLPLFLHAACVSFPTEEIDRAITSFDRAIGSLSQESADWRVVVTDLQEEVTEDMQSTIRNEVENLTRSAVLTAGGELRCNAEFMRIKLERELRRIRNNLVSDLNTASWSLFGQNLIPLMPEIAVEPFICDAIPSAVDLHVEADRRAKIDIFGFDLRSMPITAHLITQGELTVNAGVLSPVEFARQIDAIRPTLSAAAASGIEASTFTLQRPSSRVQKDISSALSVISDFHAVLDLTESGVEITPNSKTVALSWNGIAQSHIPVLAHQQVLECKIVDAQALESSQNFEPPYVNHNECDNTPDRDYDGHGPCVFFKLYLNTDPAKQKITARYVMDAHECPNDHGYWKKDCTQAMGWKETLLFTAQDNQEILSFDVDTVLEYRYIDNDHEVDVKSFGGREPVRYLEFTGDTGGDDAGIDTGVEIGFRRMNIKLEECELN